MAWTKYTITGNIHSNGMFHGKKEEYSLLNEQNECIIIVNNDKKLCLISKIWRTV